MLTSDPSVPRNSAGIRAKHPKKLEMDKLSNNYNLMRSELQSTTFHKEFEKIAILNEKYENLQSEIFQLHEQMAKEIFADVNVIFSPNEEVDENNLIHFQPDVQMIVNTKFYHKVNVWKTLAQV